MKSAIHMFHALKLSDTNFFFKMYIHYTGICGKLLFRIEVPSKVLGPKKDKVLTT